MNKYDYRPMARVSGVKFSYDLPGWIPRKMIQADIPLFSFWLSCNEECNSKYGYYCKHYHKMMLKDYGSDPSQLIFLVPL